MDFIMNLIPEDYYIQAMEILTIAAILVLLGYFFYSLRVFKKN